MKQTAVEWLQNHLTVHFSEIEQQIRFKGLFDKAKDLEKRHIMDTWYDGVDKEGIEHGHTYLWHRKDLAEQYYNETFKKL